MPAEAVVVSASGHKLFEVQFQCFRSGLHFNLKHDLCTINTWYITSLSWAL